MPLPIICKVNALYNNHLPPPTGHITFITPVYNRKELLRRAIESVKHQTYKNIEHIIVDDGSSDNPEEIVIPYLESAEYPVLFIKKENGGVHTARNIAIKHARGEFTIFLDSDDELITTATENFITAWNDIPTDPKRHCREIVGLCVDENYRLMGRPFPDGINQLTGKELTKALKIANGAHMAMLRTDTLKSCPWPEPDGVKFVAESLVWQQLNQKYSRKFLNKAVYVYHTETEVSNTKDFKVKNIQNSINDLFRYQYISNNPQAFGLSVKDRFKYLMLYTIFRTHLKSANKFPQTDWAGKGLTDRTNRVLSALLTLPARLLLATKLKRRFSRT